MKLPSLLIALATTAAFSQGPLTPPGAPAPTMKTLDQIEPRTPINVTNTPGDDDSLFKITQPGSYYLTGNIVGVAGKGGIEIESDNVTIDLTGHSLLGVAGSVDGIFADNIINFKNITVRNGIVSNWGQNALRLNVSSSLVEWIHATDNSFIGISAGHRAIVRSCTALRNTASGINTGGDAQIESCICSENGSGITTTYRSKVTGCSVTFNTTGNGIAVEGSSIVTACTVVANHLDGIQATAACLVTHNNCSGNGNGAGDGAGIRAIYGDNRIEGNNCVGADRGIDVNQAGNIIFKNTCSGNTTNWSIAANNVFGPIIDRTAPGSALVNGNSAPDSSGSDHPNANFTY
jgi:parallel beta-helix repeat protein